MTFEDILDNWTKDSDIDKTELGDESLKTQKLHAKYFKIYLEEKIKLNRLRAEYKKLHLAKYEFYSQGPSQEQIKLGWELPSKGVIIKTEVPMYLEADKDIIGMNLKVSTQLEKVDLLMGIIKELKQRGYAIKNCLDWMKWVGGSG